MEQILGYIGVGGISAVILSVFIEIVPVKVYPIKWLGNHFNAGAIEKTAQLEKKLDEHIAQSYRNKILQAQADLLNKRLFTQEEFDEVIDACSAYEKHCKENEVQNDKCKLAINYIKRMYETCQTNRSFLNLPVQKDA